jgi:hypothetical protein
MRYHSENQGGRLPSLYLLFEHFARKKVLIFSIWSSGIGREIT